MGEKRERKEEKATLWFALRLRRLYLSTVGDKERRQEGRGGGISEKGGWGNDFKIHTTTETPFFISALGMSSWTKVFAKKGFSENEKWKRHAAHKKPGFGQLVRILRVRKALTSVLSFVRARIFVAQIVFWNLFDWRNFECWYFS